MMRNKWAITFLGLILTSVISFDARCQSSTAPNTMPTIGDPVPLSPNAAAFAKYGEIPVSYYTGIPNISVPIYEIKTGGLDVPIDLSYHAGGVRIEEIASWVGTGWSLNAGGVISRQLRGLADEADGGYLQLYDTINKMTNGTLTYDGQLLFFQNVEQGIWDSQQDIFTYSVGGESGKFILDSTGAAFTIPASLNKFQLIGGGGQPAYWKMTDIHGIQYFFNSAETTTTIPVQNGVISSSPPPPVVTSWYLSKIVNAQGTDSINFIYDMELVTSNSSVAQTRYLLNTVESINYSVCPQLSLDSKYSRSTTTTRRLSQIIFRNGTINFTPNSQPRCDLASDYALSSIEINNTDSSFNEIYTFFQHYSSPTGTVDCTTPENNRLFLDSVRFSDASGGNTGSYHFAYNPMPLPSRLSYDQDYWGYYNDAGNGGNLVPAENMPNPSGTGLLTLPGANRNPNSTFNQAGILQSITYPTGGSTVFTYESNTAGNVGTLNSGAADVIVGHHQFDVGPVVPPETEFDTTFQLSDSYDGLNGVEATVTINTGCGQEHMVGCPAVTLTGPGVDYPITTNTSLFLPEGTYTLKIDMRTVIEDSIANNFGIELLWAYGASSVDTLKYNVPVGGLRIKTITGYAANNTVTNVHNFQYLFPDSAYHSSGFLLNFPQYTGTMQINAVVNNSAPAICLFNTFNSASNYPLASTQSSYVGYKYVQETLGINGEFGKNVYQFQASDVYPDLGNASIFPYPPMESQDWERSQALYEQSYRFNSSTGQYELVNQRISSYTPLTTHIYAGYQIGRIIFYDGEQDQAGLANYQYALCNISAGWTPLVNDVGRLYDQANLSAYNQKTTAYTYSNVHYQPISVKVDNSNGDSTTTFMRYPLDFTGLTGADAFTSGIAALQNANMVTPVIEKYVQRWSPTGAFIGTTSAVLASYKSCCLLPDTTWATQFAAPATSFQPLTVNAGNLVKDGSYVPQIAVVRYDTFSNPVEQLKLNDARQAYIWDYLGEYPICKVINADSNSIAYTSFEADGTGNWVIGSGAVDTAMALTGNKSYNLTGTISKSGLNSSTTYIVSYWTMNNSAFSISGTISGYPVQGKTETINGNQWTLYVHKVAGQSTISVSGSGHIDELRLYPSTAQMTTYTYSPLVGMTSQTDVGNRVTYYEYDGLARLKRIRDQDYNILKTYEYQYQVPAGCNGCQSLAMETFLGTNTIGYPVGVFDIHGNLVGNAAGASAYVSLWNSDTADARVGTLSAGSDSLHFNIVLHTGQTLPASVTGCRYFQVDLAYTNIDGVRNFNGTYVDFGDGTGMHLGTGLLDTPAVIPPYTTHGIQGVDVGYISYPGVVYDHTYPNNILKTLTFYHNDAGERSDFDNLYDPAPSLTFLANLRGNLPLNTPNIGGSCYQQSSMTSVANIANWSSIHSIQSFRLNNGDRTNPCKNISYPQDFLANDPGLISIMTNWLAHHPGNGDSSFKLTRLKSNWNTYFTQLQSISISEDDWNHEDLSGLTNLHVFAMTASGQVQDDPSSPLVPLDSTEIDNILIQIAAGAGQTVSYGSIGIATGGTTRTHASDLAYAILMNKKWIINFDTTTR